MKIEETWAKKRAAFFATNPKCAECGRAIDHYTRTQLCRLCQKDKYKKAARAQEPGRSRAYRLKHKKRIRAYQQKYYLLNSEAISARKKAKYHEQKQLTASYI